MHNIKNKQSIILLLFITSIAAVGCATIEKSAVKSSPTSKADPIKISTHQTHPPVLGKTALVTLVPYFQSIQNGDAALALSEDRLQDAIDGFDAVAKTVGDPTLKHRAQFLSAYLSYYVGNANRAFAELPTLAKSLPLLADVANEVTALAAFRLEKYEACIAYAKKMESNPATAALLIGDSYQQQKKYEDALHQYRTVLANWPDIARAESQAKIVGCITIITEPYKPSSKEPAAAELKTKSNSGKSHEEASSQIHSTDGSADTDTEAVEKLAHLVKEGLGTTPGDPNEYLRSLIDEALTIIDAMSAQAPAGKWTKEASATEDELLKRIGRTPSKTKKESQLAQKLYDEAREDMLKRRHDKALKGYTKAIKFAKRGGALECRARYEQAIVTGFKRKHSEAADLFSEVAADCDNPEIRLKSYYKAGKSCMSASRFKEAIERFSEVEKQFATHSYADDARLHSARCYLSLGNEKKFLELVSTLPDDYPTGDMRAEALWVGAKRALDSENLEAAKELLEKYYQMFPIEKGWYTAGRAGYWYGRVLERLGEIDEALERYEYVISTTPFSFYMVLAYSRLTDIDGMRAELLMSELVPNVGEDETAISEKLLTKGVFAQGAELIRLGLTSRGTKLIKKLLTQPETKPEVHRAAAALFRHVGSFTDAKEISTSVNDGWKNRYPTGTDYASWTLAYPKAFDDEVTFASEESGIEKALIFAIMREESSFNHKIESWANAMGLMQLILPTAKSMGKTLDLKVNRKSLRNPKTNVRLGAAYLSYLGEMFDGHPALIIPGYNAGGGAVSRWLKERGEMSLDLFVESIPFEQTRGYTKRVLATYATYTFLYNKKRPFLILDFSLTD